MVTLGIGVTWLVSLAAAWQIGANYAAPRLSSVKARMQAAEAGLQQTSAELEATKERLAIIERSDQVSRTANESLQDSLREREEEISALRADLAFYQRLVGGRSQRMGLTVHGVALKPIGKSGGHALRLTLTQNLKKGAVNQGAVEIAVEGVQDKRLRTLSWSELVQDENPVPMTFSFKYFQQLDGSLMLPDGFTPNRIVVVVKSQGGERVERSFPWNEALASGENGDVWQ
jgi:hypothetical protein